VIKKVILASPRGFCAGVVRAIEKGFFQREIADAAYRYQREIEQHKRIIVGINEYVEEGKPEIDILKISPEVEAEQHRRLKKLREKRDNNTCKKRLEDLKAACKGTDNVMPKILECTRAYCTLGEIVEAMKEIFGTYTEAPLF